MILPEQREAFVTAYHADPTDLKGACRAARVPEAYGTRMLVDARVNYMLAQRRTTAARDAGVKAEDILRRLAQIAFADPRELIMPVTAADGSTTVLIGDSRDYSADAAALYAGAKQTKDSIEIKMHDQMAALKVLAAYAGIVTEAGKLELGATQEVREIVRRIVRATPPEQGGTLAPEVPA